MTAATCPEWCAEHIDETARGDGFTHRRDWLEVQR